MACDSNNDQAQKAIKVPQALRQCRICFEGGEDLIAPCMCSGTSKWVHRSCLNRWRVSGTNPSSLTQCCECKFQYQLEVHRIRDLRSEEIRRQFTRQLLSHSLLWLFGAQPLIIALGVLIKLVDAHDRLVSFLHLEKLAKVYGFFPDLQHYALTYYVAGILACLPIIGLMVLADICCGARPPMRQCQVLTEGCELCCMAANPVVICTCDFFPMVGFAQLCELLFMAAGIEMLIVLGIFLGCAILVIGIVAAVVALVMIIVRIAQRYVRLKEMGILAEEYSVKDLAAPQQSNVKTVVQQDMEQGAAATSPQQLDEASQEEIQKLVEEELQAIFGGPVPRGPGLNRRQANATGYGST